MLGIEMIPAPVDRLVSGANALADRVVEAAGLEAAARRALALAEPDDRPAVNAALTSMRRERQRLWGLLLGCIETIERSNDRQGAQRLLDATLRRCAAARDEAVAPAA